MKDVNIKISVDTSNAESNLNTLDNSISKLGNTSKSTENKVEGLDKSIKKSKGGMDTLSNSANKTASAEKNMGNEAATASTKVKKLNNTTGQANNAVIELGRVASDAEYGLRGMGNNISQLATQIFQLMASQTQATAATKANTVVTSTNAITTKSAANASKGASTAIAGQTAVTAVATTTTLGFVGAMKALGGVRMGPLGFLFLIQGAIAAITAWANSSDDAEMSTDEFADSISALTKQINENNVAQQNLNQTISSYITRSYEMAAVTEEQKRVGDDAAAALALYNEKVAEAEKLEGQLADKKHFRSGLETLLTKAVKDASNAMIEYDALLKEAIRLENEMIELKKEANAPEEGTLKYWEMQLADQKKEQTNNAKNAGMFQAYADNMEGIQKQIDAITGGPKGKTPKAPKDTSERDKAAIDAEINAHLDKHKTLQKAEEDAANRKYDKLAEDAKKYGYKSVEIEKARVHALADIKEEYSLLEQEQEVDRNQRKNDLALNQKQWEDENIDNPEDKYLAKQNTIELEMEQLTNRYVTEREMYKDDKDKLLELEADYLDSSQELKQRAADLETKRAEELAEDAEKKAKDKKKKAKKLAADELAIQTAYEEAILDLRDAGFNAAEGAFDLLARLAGENKALQGIAIVGENAVAVARVITDTVATNKKLTSIAVTEGAAAIASAASYDFAASALHGTASATASAGIATNNIAAGTSIAASVGAAAQGLAALGESGNLSGGSVPDSSGGGDIPAPTFNLVEGSEGNQIQNSIQNAGDTPLRAYVVADDVTSQQSLDRQIEANSGI